MIRARREAADRQIDERHVRRHLDHAGEAAHFVRHAGGVRFEDADGGGVGGAGAAEDGVAAGGLDGGEDGGGGGGAGGGDQLGGEGGGDLVDAWDGGLVGGRWERIPEGGWVGVGGGLTIEFVEGGGDFVDAAFAAEGDGEDGLEGGDHGGGAASGADVALLCYL